MATIKAGTYRFNDVLDMTTFVSIYDDQEDIPISFTIPSGFGLNTDTQTLYLTNETLLCNYIFRNNEVLCYSAEGSSPPVYANGLGWNVLPVAYAELGFTAIDDFDGYGQTITIPEDTEVSPEFAEWFTANAVEVKSTVTLKAGTYRFNDVLSVPSYAELYEPVIFTSNGKTYDLLMSGNGSIDGVFLGYANIATEAADYTYSDENASVLTGFTGWANEAYKTITIPEDSVVSPEFYTWFTANAKRLSTITYNGATIATLNGGQTATIKCAGNKMKSDIVVEVAENASGGPVDLSSIPEVESLDNPTTKSPTAVIYDGEIYLLCEGELNNANL